MGKKEELRLKFLNVEKDTLQYLPFGATSIGFTVENNNKNGYFRPENHAINDAASRFVGFAADNNEDFLVIWGAGRDDGQFAEANSKSKMFFQLLHVGDNTPDTKIIFEHTEDCFWRQTLNLTPATKTDNIVRMKTTANGNNRTITFCGEKVPSYYCRWWPPNPAKNQKTKYTKMNYPKIEIQYSENREGITSPVEISLQMQKEKNEKNKILKKKIITVQGDIDYAFPRVELFSLLPEQQIFVLRLWLYWIHRRAQNVFLEIPDIERFDFVIDAKNGKVPWYGTDYHYQEYWSRVNDEVAEARIAKGIEIILTLKNIANRAAWMVPDKNYNPIKEVIKKIKTEQAKASETGKSKKDKQLSVETKKIPEDKTTRVFPQTRTHVPFVKNCKTEKGLISSVISEQI